MVNILNEDWKILEFYVPIDEVKEVVNETTNVFLIRGVAINETTTLNNVKYVSEELEKAAATFRNVPILLDHKNEVRNIVGRTTENVNFNHTNKRIDFEAKIMDKGIREMIKDGRIGSVSIGAKVSDLTEEEDGSMKAMGIQGLEISLVAVPGDSQATLAQAIKNSFKLKEMSKLKDTPDIELNLQGGNKMTDEIKKENAESEEPKEEVKEEAEEVKAEAPAEEVKAEEKIQNINVKVDTSEMAEMKTQIAELKELLVAKKAIKEEAEVEAKDETKGEVSEDKAEESIKDIDNKILEAAGRGSYSIYANYTADSKLKRLIR